MNCTKKKIAFIDFFAGIGGFLMAMHSVEGECMFASNGNFLAGYMKSQNKKVKYLQMDITYYGKCFPKIKYYTTKEENANFYSLREDDGLWFGFDLDGHIPINVHLFFFDGRWYTNCEHCERGVDGEWNHYYDSNIYCENIKVKYIC